MNGLVRCRCARCTAHGIKGPALLITLGVLFLLGQWQGEFLQFRYTWPVLLIVLGLIKLVESFSSSEGHVMSGTQAPQGQGH